MFTKTKPSLRGRHGDRHVATAFKRPVATFQYALDRLVTVFRFTHFPFHHLQHLVIPTIIPFQTGFGLGGDVPFGPCTGHVMPRVTTGRRVHASSPSRKGRRRLESYRAIQPFHGRVDLIRQFRRTRFEDDRKEFLRSIGVIEPFDDAVPEVRDPAQRLVCDPGRRGVGGGTQILGEPTGIFPVPRVRDVDLLGFLLHAIVPLPGFTRALDAEIKRGYEAIDGIANVHQGEPSSSPARHGRSTTGGGMTFLHMNTPSVDEIFHRTRTTSFADMEQRGL